MNKASPPLAEKPGVMQPADDEARVLAKGLVRGARFAALAALEPGTGHPLASRVAVGCDMDGSPVLLVSALSSHTPALNADPRCSLLFGEPGKGDPLAHPRITVLGRAEKIARDTPLHVRLRRRYLLRHPKAKLYVDFADFAFFRVAVERASLNGGFGKAYDLANTDLLTDMSGMDDLVAAESGAVDHMNSDHADAIGLYATVLAGQADGPWRMASLDPEGLDLVCGDDLVRLPFTSPLQSPADLRPTLVTMAKRARATDGG